MLFIDILLLFLYEVDSYESTNRVYETLTILCKLSSLITLLLNVSQFAKDNSIFFKFHSHLYLVKSHETNKIFLQGVVGADGLYSFNNLKLHGNPSLLMSTSASIPNVDFPTSTATVNNTSNVVSNFGVNPSSNANLWHASLGHPNDHVMKIVLKQCNISQLNKNITVLFFLLYG